MAYSRSSATKSRKAPVCSGVQTMTGEGFSPVCRHRATRSSVHTSALGFRTGSSSTWAAGLKVMICWAIASLSAARRVALMRCRVAGPVTRRNGGIASMAAFMALRRARGVRALPRDRGQLLDRRAPLGVLLQDLGVVRRRWP